MRYKGRYVVFNHTDYNCGVLLGLHMPALMTLTSRLSIIIIYGKENSVKNTTINVWLNDGVYKQ